MTSPVLSVENIDVFYGASQILFGVGLEVQAGQTMALLGRNGAGKSTTMKAIAGLAAPRKGHVHFLGHDVTARKPYIMARQGLAFVPEDRQVFPDHTVQDNLIIAAKKGPQGQDDWPLKRIYEVFPLLEPLKARAAGRLSGGEQQMLAIARALMGNPVMLLLDEPSEGLAPIIVARIGTLLKQLRGAGATVLIAEQNMHFCLGIASDAVVIDKGQIVYRDTIAGLKANKEVRSRYLAM
ncbi:MAG TPA: ABC transporter ATP-binding protein [Acetobacteraceae bacterium]|jgi:branched-chain amino acid transport system ATP-binding protein|nr:ABC transporter ATP-binding protein [Acetobacteraceae bacterium]